MTANVFATSFPALTGATITQGHADYCEAHGHATHTVDGVVSGSCPRCGEWTQAQGDTITWNGETVTRKFTAYQSRKAAEVRGKFGGVANYPDEFAVSDQTGYIVARFSTMEDADRDATDRNAEEMTSSPATYCDAHYPLILDGYRLWCRLDAGHTGNHECEAPDEAWSGSTYEWADQPECYTTF